MRKTNALLGVLVIVTLASGVAEASHGGEKCFGFDLPGGGGPMGSIPDDVYCPDPVVRGASCLAYGILVTFDSSGFPTDVGDVVNDWSESRAWTQAVPGKVPQPIPFPGQQNDFPPPPSDPQAHADAEQVGVTYNNPTLLGGVGLDTSTVFSRCDVVALQDPAFGLYTEAYGRGGVEDFELNLPGLGIAVEAEALDFELHAYGVFGFTWAFSACDVAQLGATPPGLTIAFCPTPNFGIGVLGVTVEVNEQWGPLPNFAGQTVYGGAALHVTVATTVGTLEVYVGYATVAVSGGPGPLIWIADPLLGPGPMPCLPSPCQP